MSGNPESPLTPSEQDDILYRRLVQSAVTHAFLGQWATWSSGAMRQPPVWGLEWPDTIEKYREDIVTAAFPGTRPELERALRSLSYAMGLAIRTFLKYHPRAEGNCLVGEAFYRRGYGKPDEAEVMESYDTWLRECALSVSEATKAANWVAETVRQSLDKPFLDQTWLHFQDGSSRMVARYSEEEKQARPAHVQNLFALAQHQKRTVEAEMWGDPPPPLPKPVVEGQPTHSSPPTSTTSRIESGGRATQKAQPTLPQYDVFISHASEDKDEFVNPLAQELTRLGLKVWYDKTALTLGDSLRGKIDEGLACSDYGVVILSHSFFAKQWTQAELGGLFARQLRGRKVILPVRHGVTTNDLLKYSPMLADKLAALTEHGIEAVARQILEVVRSGNHSSHDSDDTPSNTKPPKPRRRASPAAEWCAALSVIALVVQLLYPTFFRSIFTSIFRDKPRIQASFTGGRIYTSRFISTETPLELTLRNSGAPISIEKVELELALLPLADFQAIWPTAGAVNSVGPDAPLGKDTPLRLDQNDSKALRFSWDDIIYTHIYTAASKGTNYIALHWYLAIVPAVGDYLIIDVSDQIFPALHTAVLAPERLPQSLKDRLEVARQKGKELRTRNDKSIEKIIQNGFPQILYEGKELDDAMREAEAKRKMTKP